MFGTRVWPEKGYEKYGRVRVAGDRIVKALILLNYRYDTIIVGSSRPLIGFNPDAKAFRKRHVYNSAFNGATNLENTGVVRFVLAHQTGLKDLIIGLDFFAFETYQTEADYEQSAFSGASPWLGYAARTFSKSAMDGAWRFWRNVRQETPQVTVDGFNFTPAKWLKNRRETFLAKARGAGSNCTTISTFASNLDRNLALLEPALVSAKARGVNIHLFISPQHVWAHAAEEASGRTARYENFKRSLRAMTDRLGVKPGSGQIALWDFDGLDVVTLENVPSVGNGLDTLFFWEHSHFKRTTGDAILSKMFGEAGSIDGFGQRLDLIDIDAHLSATREKLKQWEADNPEDTATLRGFVNANKNCRGDANDIEN